MTKTSRMSSHLRHTIIEALELSKCLDVSLEDMRIVAAKRDMFFAHIPLQDALCHISQERQKRACSYRFLKDQQLSILAALILDYLIADYGLCEKKMTYCFNEAGKPAFYAHPELHFNMSHSGEIAIAAVGARPVGVDVEDISSFPAHICNPYKWVALEAIGKAKGVGLSEEVINQPLRLDGEYELCWHYVDEYAMGLCYKKAKSP